jgi:taurine dioxygenase
MPETLTATTHVGITRLAGQIGAEITGVDTGTPLSDEVIARIRQALLDHKVVFLRGQSLNYRRQVAFAERLGPLTLGHPTLASPPGQPLLEEIDSLKGGKVNYWHTDVTFVDRPPAFTLLHAVVIPPVGGDTLWASTVTAYQSLPPELRDLADRLRVLHTNDFDYARTFNRGERVDPALEAAHEEFISTVYETEHPLVRVHPETSERSLVLGGFARTVLGFTPQASRDLIRLLQDYITRPEHTVRWRWREGDLAIWDNRATQHYAIADYGTAHRRGERVTVAGPVPVGVDGRPSVAVRGDASAYYVGGADH